MQDQVMTLIPLMRRYARRYTSRGIDCPDAFISEATLAVLKALPRYDPERAPLETFAAPYIYRAVRLHAKRQLQSGRISYHDIGVTDLIADHLPHHEPELLIDARQQAKREHWRRQKVRLSQGEREVARQRLTLQRDRPTIVEIAKARGVTKQRVAQIEQAASRKLVPKLDRAGERKRRRLALWLDTSDRAALQRSGLHVYEAVRLAAKSPQGAGGTAVECGCCVYTRVTEETAHNATRQAALLGISVSHMVRAAIRRETP